MGHSDKVNESVPRKANERIEMIKNGGLGMVAR